MDVQLLVVPYDSGHRGARMGAGPERLVEAGIEGALTRDGHRVTTTVVGLADNSWSAEISTAFELARRVATVLAAGPRSFPVILCGNCITTLGAVASRPPQRRGIVWFDAHADFNTPDTTTTGFLDGTALSAITGQSWRQLAASVPGFKPVPEECVALVGARDLDEAEESLLSASRINRVAAADVRAQLAGAIELLAARVDGAHIHIDLDVLDASVARANSYAVGGGLTVEEMERALTIVGAALTITGATLSAYDPAGDTEGRAGQAAIRLVTATLRASIERKSSDRP